MRGLKKIFKSVLWSVLFILIWFVVVRATSGYRAVTVSGEGDFSGEWDGTLRIGCYNIAHGRGGEPGGSNWDGGSKEERGMRLGQIADLIREQDLDIVVLNEVDFACTWSHGVNQAQELAVDCGFPFVAEQRNLDLGFPFFRVAIGNVVLSRFPVLKAEEVEFPEVRWWEPVLAGKKGGVKVLLQLPDASELEVFGVHAETRDATVRKNSIRALLGAAGGSSVLAGDFNSELAGDGSTAIDLVVADTRWSEAKAGGATFPSTEPAHRIDWIFVPRGWAELSSGVVLGTLSDHAMVIGEWKVN